MTSHRLTAFCLAILTLAGCSQTTTTDPAKAGTDKAGTAQSQPPAPYSIPMDRGGGGGGGGSGGY